MRNGYGIWTSQESKGDIYEGFYENDMKSGNGVYKWKNGTTYTGSFYKDQKQGKGVIVHENGKTSKF